MKITEILIEGLEQRVEYIAKSMGQKILDAAEKDPGVGRETTPEEILQTLAKADPTGNKGESIQWLARLYASSQIRIEDVNKMRAELEKFYKVRPKLANKDLNSYKQLDQFYDATEAVDSDEEVVSKRQEKKQVKSEGAEKIIDTPDFKAVKVTGEKAACYYAANTKWCTSNEETAKSYLKSGPLYILMAKIAGKVKKFQLSYETEQFMNERDTEVNKTEIQQLSKHPGYTEFLNKLIAEKYPLAR